MTDRAIQSYIQITPVIVVCFDHDNDNDNRKWEKSNLEGDTSI